MCVCIPPPRFVSSSACCPHRRHALLIHPLHKTIYTQGQPQPQTPQNNNDDDDDAWGESDEGSEWEEDEEGDEDEDDLHRVIPACRGLRNARTRS